MTEHENAEIVRRAATGDELAWRQVQAWPCRLAASALPVPGFWVSCETPCWSGRRTSPWPAEIGYGGGIRWRHAQRGQLRHSRLTHAAEAGASTPMLMALGGHRSVRSLAKCRPKRSRAGRPRPTPPHGGDRQADDGEIELSLSGLTILCLPGRTVLTRGYSFSARAVAMRACCAAVSSDRCSSMSARPGWFLLRARGGCAPGRGSG